MAVEAETREGLLRQIADLRRQLDELKKSYPGLPHCEECYPWIFENLTDVFYRTDMTGVVVHVSRSVEKAFGYTVDEVLNEYRLDDIWACPDERERFRDVLRKQGYAKDFEMRARRRDGSVVWVSSSAAFYTDERGNVLGVEGMARDITAQKEAEESQRRSARDMEHLNRMSLELVAFPPHGDIYEFIAERLRELVGDSIAIISSFDPKASLLVCRSIVGFGKLKRAVLKLVGMDPVGMRFPVSEELAGAFAGGCAIRVPGGIAELALGQIPGPICVAVEKLLGIKAVYAMGIVREGNLLATAAILSRVEADLANRTAIETLASQASIALQHRAADAALRESEKKYRELVENISEVIYAVDCEGIVTYVSPAVERLLAYKPADVVGRELSRFVHPGDLPRVKEAVRGIFSGRPAGNEYRALTRSGDVRWMRTSSRPIFEGDRVVGLQGTLMDITDQRRLEEQMGEAIAHEQRRIGHDLHDGLGQELAGIAYMAKSLEQDLARSPDEAAGAAKIGRLIDEAIVHARNVVNALDPVGPGPDGLARALAGMASNVSDVYGISCLFGPPATVLVDDSFVSTHVFRIAQEAVNNAVRHGKAKRISIELEADGDMATLEVTDDGAGLAEGWKSAQGMGLKTMRYRSRMIDGTLRLERAAGGGTVIRCSFPRRRDRA